MADLSKILPSQLMQGVLGKLYEVLTQGDDSVPVSQDNFLSWCTPGIPITEEDLDFVSQGITAVVKKQTNPDGTSKDLSADEITKAKAGDTSGLLHHAEAFARIVDFIPDINKGTNGGLARLSIQQNEGTLSDVYKYALDFSQVANTELSEEEKAKVEKFKQLLQVKRMKKNIVTDEETEVTEASPLVVLYNEKMAAHINAVLEYHNYRISAASASSPEAVLFWAMNAKALRMKVKFAENDWITNGYKVEYEGIAARIDQIMSKDLSLLKAQYKEAMKSALLTGSASGSDYYYTILAPANFVKGGWTKFDFSSSEFNSYESSQTTSYGVKAQGGWFGFHAGGGVQHNDANEEKAIDATDFKLTFEICQVPIIRPWLKTPFLTSKAWKLDPGSPEVQSRGEFLCDGNMPPEGILPGYPTTVIFIRNLLLHFGHGSMNAKSSMESNSYEGSAGWGPFSVSANYSHEESKAETHLKQDGQGIEVNGMQIIGFNCHVLPKSPNPLPNITNWI